MKSITLAEPLDRFKPLTIPVSVWLAEGGVQRHEKILLRSGTKSSNTGKNSLFIEFAVNAAPSTPL